jgi:hypothetical protein
MKYRFARVSTDGQSVEAQVRQLAKAGCKKVFRETASGADRSQLRKALDQLDAGDVLMVTKLDRLARVGKRCSGDIAGGDPRVMGLFSAADGPCQDALNLFRVLAAISVD